MTTLTFATRYKTELIDITAEVKEAVVKSGVDGGAVNVFVPHSTCGIFVSENQDPNLKRDLLGTLHRLVPTAVKYAHTGGNAEGHIKSAIMGTNVTIPVQNATVMIGPWQGIFLGEFDGPRERTVYVNVLQ